VHAEYGVAITTPLQLQKLTPPQPLHQQPVQAL
jgi:hypothetical protein